MRRVILASASPRRRELLGEIYKDFRIEIPDVNERLDPTLPLHRQLEEIARQKGEAVFLKNQEALVISGDTGVIYQNQILGKPRDEREAIWMLENLSGKEHEVITGVSILSQEVNIVFSKRTRVRFYPLSKEEILAYVATKEPLDKAGAYGIQGIGKLWIKEIVGDYYNVMGLPIGEIYQVLKEAKLLE